MDYCRCCGKTDSETDPRATEIPHPTNGKSYVVTLCSSCIGKLRRRDHETCLKIAPFLRDT
jgi:hypothetical protein